MKAGISKTYFCTSEDGTCISKTCGRNLIDNSFPVSNVPYKTTVNLIPLEKYSSLHLLLNVTANVMKFIYKLKAKLSVRKNGTCTLHSPKR